MRDTILGFLILPFILCLIVPLASSAAEPDIRIDMHIIGFSVDAGTERQLRDMAAAGGGRYYSSTNETELLTALGEAVGVDVPSGQALETVESEPNNSFGTADSIASMGAVQGKIQPTRDADWYRFEVDRQGALAVRISPSPANLEMVFRVWNMEKNTVSDWIAPLSTGGDTLGIVDLSSPGEYRLEVRDGRDDAESADDYSLSLFFAPTADETEPNNTFGTAAKIDIGQEISANILPLRDADWYRLDVAHQGALNVKITGVPPELDVVFRVWNMEKNTVSDWIAPLAKGGDTDGTVDLAQPGTYYLEVRDGRDDARLEKPYKLTAGFAPTADQDEPNNSFGTASPMKLGLEASACILPRRDADWHRFDVPEHGELTVSIKKPPANLDMVFRVWDLEKNTLTGWIAPLAKGGDTTGVIDLPQKGRYFLEIRDGADDDRSPDPYTLKADFIPSVDRFEPNNRYEDAQPAPVGQSFQATILPRRDVDFFKFNATAAGTLKVAITNVPKNLDLVFRVWNEKKSLIRDWFRPLAKGGDVTGETTLPGPGDYIVEVADGSSDDRSIEPYTIYLDLLGQAQP